MTFLSISYSSNSGGLLFDPSLPVENGNVNASIPSVAFGETLGVFGRPSQVLAVLPYVSADLSGKVTDGIQSRHRSWLVDSRFRFAMNIHGAPAMHLKQFAEYHPKMVVSASPPVTAPTGQYDLACAGRNLLHGGRTYVGKTVHADFQGYTLWRNIRDSSRSSTGAATGLLPERHASDWLRHSFDLCHVPSDLR
jgi:hypothetical protein